MRVLIAYAGKTGTTAKCAKILKALVDNAELCDLTKEKPSLSNYEKVIVGGSIRMGQIHKAAKQFLVKNQEALKQKTCAFFICNCSAKENKSLIEKNIPKELLRRATATASFGGEMNLEDQKGMDRAIVKMLSKSKAGSTMKTSISTEAIHKFAEKVN